MLRIVEVLGNVLVWISEVAALNWSNTIYPNLRYPSSKRRKSTFFQEKWPGSTLNINDVPETLETILEGKWPECTLDISDVPETYVENSCGP